MEMANLPVLRVRGTHREIGHQTGLAFRKEIQAMIFDWVDKPGVMLPFYNTKDGRDVVNKYLETSRHAYPMYVEEIEGMATGADIPFIKLFLANISREIGTYVKQVSAAPDGSCTDLVLLNDKQGLLVHTEDTATWAAEMGYMLEATVTASSDSTVILEEFLAYSYIGLLPGNAFSINKDGACTTMNILYLQSAFTNGIPHRLLTRALMCARSVEEARTITEKSPGLACGFNFNIAWKSIEGRTHISSLELAGSENGTLIHQTDHRGFGYHCNHYMNLADRVKEVTSLGSSRRGGRVIQIVQQSEPGCKRDLLEIISDNEDEFPLHSVGKPPDDGVTLATAVYDLKAGVLDIYTGRPVDCEPHHRYSINGMKRHESDDKVT